MNSKQQQLEKAERAWYRAKARAEQAVDRLSDCERKVARLREELNCAEVPGGTPPESHGAIGVRRTSRITTKQFAEKVHFRRVLVAQALLPVLCFQLLSDQGTAKSGCATDFFRKL